MIYTQYKEASLKHLQACKTALYGLNFYRGRSGTIPSTPQSSREALLLDIFYLSGYTLEGIINYAIYKKIGWTSDVKNMVNIPYSIAYKNNPGSGFHPTYWILQHKFNRNVDVLNALLPGNTIPVINRSVYIAPILKKMIFDSIGGVQNFDFWKPEIRYEPTHWILGKYTEQDIKDLVILTEQVYIQLQTV